MYKIITPSSPSDAPPSMFPKGTVMELKSVASPPTFKAAYKWLVYCNDEDVVVAYRLQNPTANIKFIGDDAYDRIRNYTAYHNEPCTITDLMRLVNAPVKARKK